MVFASSILWLIFFQSEEKEAIFRILAAVLHLGNMYFGSTDVSCLFKILFIISILII